MLTRAIYTQSWKKKLSGDYKVDNPKQSNRFIH